MKNRLFVLAFLLLLTLLVPSGVAAQGDPPLPELGGLAPNEKLTRLEAWYNDRFFFVQKVRKPRLLQKMETQVERSGDEMLKAAVLFYRGLYVQALDNGDYPRGERMMEQGIALAERTGNELQTAYFRHSLGYYYFYERKDYARSLTQMLRAHAVFERIGYDTVRDAPGHLDRLAFVYYHLNNFTQAIRHLKEALNHPPLSQRRQIGILNSIGQSYREMFESDSARVYFIRSRELALAAKDTPWIGISSGDIAREFLREAQYGKALPYMSDYYRLARKGKDRALEAEALAGLGEIDLALGQRAAALGKLQQAETLFRDAFPDGKIPFEHYKRQAYIFQTLSKAWEAEGRTDRALGYLHRAHSVTDSIERRALISRNAAIQQLFEAEQTARRFQEMEEEKRTAEHKQYLLLVIAILLALVLLLLLNRMLKSRQLEKQRQALVQLEKTAARNELHHARTLLENYVHNLREKTELLDRAQSEIHQFRQQHSQSFDLEQQALQKLRDSSILTAEHWQEFRNLFEKVHPGFLSKLKQHYPGLTPGEMRLFALMKLELTNQDMAAMMGVSAMSVKKARQRLRKKIGLPEEQKIESILATL